MISVWNLLWIVPLSATFGIAWLALFVAGSDKK